METERLLSKVETEIRQSEEEQKRQDQKNTLYEQAHGLLRSKKWRQALEKIEAIRKLDEQFEDTEKIAGRAQKELAREEQEAERQNELAAMYAEAVRLLREEKYQEALEKWQEIKSIDSKYPDRQKVQKTAKKSLTTLAKPVTAKRRITLPKSLWIGLGGIVIVGVIILALNLSGNNGEEPSPPGISAPTSASGGKAVAPTPTTTKTPVKTSATSRPTATQTTSGYADPTIYDDFDNVAYNDKVNNALWAYEGYTSSKRVFQENGSSVFTVSEFNNCASVAVNEDSKPITNPMFIEARMMLDPDTTVGGTDLGITFNAEDGHSVCSIFPGQDTQEISCWSRYFGVDQRGYKVGIVPGTWHILRLEVYPETMQFSYLVDGEEIGAYIPRNGKPLKSLDYAIIARLCNWGGYVQNPVGYMDYFKIGLVE